jgi:SAM-dependent methyltransferase
MPSSTENGVEIGRDEYSGTASVDGFWRSSEADALMQRGNACAFEAIAASEADRLRGATVIDVGCNMGGFLRFLCQGHSVARGFGLDPAESTVLQARASSVGLPIEYAVASRPPAEWPAADIAFSQEVVYLIDDLAEHAADMWRALRPGGRYVAITSVHRESELMATWHAVNQENLHMPPLRSVQEYIEPFMQIRAVPIEEVDLVRAWDLLEFWTRTNDKVMFQFTKPGDASA